MPGLINKGKRTALPLCVSEITSCVRGYTLAMTVSMSYNNIEDHPIEGIFIYPLDECTTMVGFEAMVSNRIITVQIRDKAKIDDSYFDCCSVANGAFQTGSGHIVLDEDLERTVLVVNLGVIPPLETVTVLVSTSSELTTLPNGAVKVTSPTVCTPKVQRSVNEEQGFSPNLARVKDRHHCALGPHDQGSTNSQLCLAWLLEEEPINSIDYEFNFQLEIRGPYLLAGVESPTHAIRADADPSARSATTVVITLADKYTYDCPVEILIYPSEPHMPHILIEDGDMTAEEYEEHLKGRSDYIRGTRRDPSDEKKVEIIRKRLHKDMLHNPVVMLNFCPDLKALTSDLRRVQGEFIFLIDRSGSMSGVNISRVKEAMVVILKSLVPACLFNIIGFGSTFKTLFPSSQSYGEETLASACEHIKKIRADMGGTNILAPLNWILQQPLYRGHPRLLFLLTDGAVSNTGKVIELVRSHARFTRCYTFGIGQNACRRLVIGLSTVSKGTAEFLAEGERLQPKMIKSLKKSMAPVLSDIAIEWLFPETKEVLLSPVGSTYLFPGDCLIGYSVVCDTARYHANPKSDKRRRYRMMRSNDSTSSVFYQSQEEDHGKSAPESWAATTEGVVTPIYDTYQEMASERNRAPAEQDVMECKTSRRRAYSTNQIVDYNLMKRAYTPSDPNSAAGKYSLRRANVQDPSSHPGPHHGAQWSTDYQPQLASLCAASSRSRTPATQRASHDWEVEAPPSGTGVQAEARSRATMDRCRFTTDTPSVSSCGEPEGYTHQLCEVETPLEPFPPDSNAANLDDRSCKAVITGLLCGKPVKWEVAFDLEPCLRGREREEKVHEDLWNETFHHLAARSIIQDFEQMAEKECEIEHGSGRRYQLYAIHTSKACNILSKYTAFVPIDLDTNEYLQTGIEYTSPGEALRQGSHTGSRSGSRKHRGYSIGLGRSQSVCTSEGAEDSPLPMNVEDGMSPCSTPSSSGWERCSFPEAPQRSPSMASEHSQRSVETLFSARLSLTRTRLLTRAARGFMCRSPSKASESAGEGEADNNDYIPLVSLQLACGAFALNSALCETINVPMDKLKWTSPFTSHRVSLTHGSHSGGHKTEGHDDSGTAGSPFRAPTREELGATPSPALPSRSPQTEGELAAPFHGYPVEPPHSPANSQTDSGRGSESEGTETPPALSCPQGYPEQEGMIWATAVALAWLEHSSADYFIEWELIAAKASMWLSAQAIPEGRDLAAIKTAANQLFVILRHWDENLQLNMLCYNPNSV
ncbi:von Willebrand factor A domain-containing protein 5B1-like [Megalops cyprinoides]|uniref:von Willebrand factor A domain-containing protein 5B1-like n=1 Tax=Megalops cyprinoides TaxID=118141 RepID=UPI0018645841|nr:von Willebrand factor A domain-containing protein 5B1-like [Megalops cyprinoides]